MQKPEVEPENVSTPQEKSRLNSPDTSAPDRENPTQESNPIPSTPSLATENGMGKDGMRERESCRQLVEITQGATTLIIETTKLTAEILQAAMLKALKEIQKGVSNRGSKLYRGKQTIRQLMRHNTGISNIDITDSNIKAFSETAAHDLTPGKWASYDDEQHKRLNTCACGYTSDEYDFHEDSDNDGTCDYVTSRFSVTVPASMALTVSEDGEVYAADNAKIVNGSTAPVRVTGVSVASAGDWTLVPFQYNMAAAKVDAMLIGFSLNGAATTVTGDSENLALSGGWEIGQGKSLALDYDANVSATSRVIQGEQVLTLVFVVQWANV